MVEFFISGVIGVVAVVPGRWLCLGVLVWRSSRFSVRWFREKCLKN